MREIAGELSHGARYLARVPDNWNGVLLNNLDYAENAVGVPDESSYLWRRGFAFSGSSRVSAMWHTDVNLDHQSVVLETFTKQFGRPLHSIQLGGSGGGTITLQMVERYPELVDGGVAVGAASMPMLLHLWADFLYLTQALLSPTPLRPLDSPGESSDGFVPADHDPEYWDGLITRAQQTPVGRARIALIVALAQWPSWAWGVGPKPESDLPPSVDDPVAVQAAMCLTARSTVMCLPFVTARPVQPYSNQETDYSTYLDVADADQRRTVMACYDAASGNADRAIADDLRRVAESERWISFATAAETVHPNTGRPLKPLFHVSTMDALVPPVALRSYAERVHGSRHESLYRQAIVERANHCGLSETELAVVIESTVVAISTQDWPSTDPASLNSRANEIESGSPRFSDHRPPLPNRMIFSEN